MVLDLIFSIILFCFIVICVVWNIARFIYFIKCFKIKKCSNRNCRMNFCCDKYKEVLTAEEAEMLLKMLDEFK